MLDLFSFDPPADMTNYPANKIFTDFPLSEDVALAYAEKFSDSGNHVVVLIYAVAFGAYLALGQYPELRAKAYKHRIPMVLMAVVGNLALLYLLVRLATHEYRLMRAFTDNPLLMDAIWSALEMRVVLLVVNLVIYIYILLRIIEPTDPQKAD